MFDLEPFIREFRLDTLGGDRTSACTIPAQATMRAIIVAREPLVVTATTLIAALPQALHLNIETSLLVTDGQRLNPGDTLAQLNGSARDILALERTLLNGLQILCGIASETARWVKALPANVTLLDTRKTHPGLRMWERLAVQAGGGANHRFNLADTVLIKDNHLAIGGGVKTAVENAVKLAGSGVKIICEVENLKDAETAIAAGANGLLVDNVPVDLWPAYWQKTPATVSLEFSGGIDFEHLAKIPAPPRSIAISTSKTIFAARAVDISLDVVPQLEQRT